MCEDYRELSNHCDMLKKAKKAKKIEEGTNKQIYVYKLGEEIANGVLFFGNQVQKNRSLYAKCICPCGEAFQGKLSQIRKGITTGCGCNRNKRGKQNG